MSRATSVKIAPVIAKNTSLPSSTFTSLVKLERAGGIGLHAARDLTGLCEALPAAECGMEAASIAARYQSQQLKEISNSPTSLSSDGKEMTFIPATECSMEAASIAAGYQLEDNPMPLTYPVGAKGASISATC